MKNKSRIQNNKGLTRVIYDGFFRYLDLNPHAPTVLRSMLQCCDQRILNLIQDSLVEVFGILDECCEQHTAAFLDVLYTLVSCMQQWDSTATGTGTGTPATSNEPSEGVGEETGDGEPLWTAAEHIQHTLVSQILDRCPHFLGHRDTRCRIICLEIVGKAVHLLRRNTQLLLPLIHLCWPSLVQRLRDSDAIVQMAAMRATVDVARAAPSFVLQRVASEAVPVLCQVLTLLYQRQSKASESSLDERHTRAHRVKVCTLQVLHDLTLQLHLGGQAVSATIIETVSLSLEERAGSGTRESSADASKLVADILRSLAVDDADAVWFQLIQSHPPRLAPLLQAPHPVFRTPRRTQACATAHQLTKPYLHASHTHTHTHIQQLLCDLQA